MCYLSGTCICLFTLSSIAIRLCSGFSLSSDCYLFSYERNSVPIHISVSTKKQSVKYLANASGVAIQVDHCLPDDDDCGALWNRSQKTHPRTTWFHGVIYPARRLRWWFYKISYNGGGAESEEYDSFHSRWKQFCLRQKKFIIHFLSKRLRPFCLCRWWSRDRHTSIVSPWQWNRT